MNDPVAAPAKRKPGRPRILGTGDKRRTVTFDTETLARARELGDGNINAGVRKALREWRELTG